MTAKLLNRTDGGLVPAFLLDDFKAEVGIAVSGGDALLTRLLSDMQADIEGFCQRFMVVRDCTELWEVSGYLGYESPFPATNDVQSVTEVSYGMSPSALSVMDRASYALAGNRVRLLQGKAWPFSSSVLDPAYVKITFKAGLAQSAAQLSTSLDALKMRAGIYLGVAQQYVNGSKQDGLGMAQRKAQGAQLLAPETIA